MPHVDTFVQVPFWALLFGAVWCVVFGGFLATIAMLILTRGR